MKVSQGIHCWLEYHKLHSKKTPSKPTSRSFPNLSRNLIKETHAEPTDPSIEVFESEIQKRALHLTQDESFY